MAYFYSHALRAAWVIAESLRSGRILHPPLRWMEKVSSSHPARATGRYGIGPYNPTGRPVSTTQAARNAQR